MAGKIPARREFLVIRPSKGKNENQRISGTGKPVFFDQRIKTGLRQTGNPYGFFHILLRMCHKIYQILSFRFCHSSIPYLGEFLENITMFFRQMVVTVFFIVIHQTARLVDPDFCGKMAGK